MANILTKRKFKKHIKNNKLNRKTKKNKWNRKTKKQIGGAIRRPKTRESRSYNSPYPYPYGSDSFKSQTSRSSRNTTAELSTKEVIDDYRNRNRNRTKKIQKSQFRDIILSRFDIDLGIAETKKPLTYNFFCDAYLKYEHLIKQKIIPKNLQPTTRNIVFIDVENLIVSASNDRAGKQIDMRIAYNNLKEIIDNFIYLYNDYTFILVNHRNTFGENDVLTLIQDKMYIINANCPDGPGCEKDDFILILLLKYFEKDYNCLVITHDNYSWYRDNFNRATITVDNPRRLQYIGHEDKQLVKAFAYSLDRV